ncbi:MAG: nucleotidyltransferase domain-containing protein [Trueperaceae bacterium]
MKTSYGNLPDLGHARSLILRGLEGYAAEVFLFGSFARGQGTLGSDIDIAVLPLEPIPSEVFSSLRNDLEEAPLLFSVELIDLSSTNWEFRERVVREGVRWDESANA